MLDESRNSPNKSVGHNIDMMPKQESLDLLIEEQSSGGVANQNLQEQSKNGIDAPEERQFSDHSNTSF